MATYYVHPSGTGANQSQCQSASTPAPSLNRLFSFVSGGTGFANGDVVCVSGTIRGTAANPEYGCASYTIDNAAIAITIQPWGIDQANPAGLTLTQPLLRGDAPVGQMTWDATGYFKTDAALPTGLTVSGATYRWGENMTRAGIPMAHLNYVTSAANCAATNNSWFYDGATGHLYVRVTKSIGTAITSGTLAAGEVGYMVASGNSLLELQRATGCTIRGFNTANTNADYGIYHCNTTDSTNCVIEDCNSLDGASHHYFGHTGAAPRTTSGCIIRRCSGRRGYGTYTAGNPASAGSFYGISNFSGTTLNNMISEDLDYQPGPVLTPDGSEINASVSKTYGAAAHVALQTSTQDGNIVRRSLFECAQGRGGSSGGSMVALGAPAPSDLVANDASTYPILYQDCVIRSSYGMIATPSATTHKAYAAFQRCLFDHSMSGSRWTTGTPIPADNYSPNCWDFNIAVGTDERSFLFDRCTFIVDMAVLGAGDVYANMFNLADSTTLRFRGCTFLMVGKNFALNNQYVFTWTSSSKLASVIAQDCIFAFPFAAANDRQLCANDSTWLASDTRRQFSGCYYLGINKFSSNGSFDTGAEFTNTSTGVDRTGRYFNSVITATGWPLFQAPTLRADLASWASNNSLRSAAVGGLTALANGPVLTRQDGGLAGSGGDGTIVYPLVPRLRGRCGY